MPLAINPALGKRVAGLEITDQVVLVVAPPAMVARVRNGLQPVLGAVVVPNRHMGATSLEEVAAPMVVVALEHAKYPMMGCRPRQEQALKESL